MSRLEMSPGLLDLVANRFKVLAEPARLQILNLLRDEELTVGELVDRSGLGQANVSKHLQLLHASGFVSRRKDGLFVYYRLADASVFELCETMCGRVEGEIKSRRELIGRGSSLL